MFESKGCGPNPAVKTFLVSFEWSLRLDGLAKDDERRKDFSKH